MIILEHITVIVSEKEQVELWVTDLAGNQSRAKRMSLFKITSIYVITTGTKVSISGHIFTEIRR